MASTIQMDYQSDQIVRIPKGVGAELKDVACAVTQVIILLEIQKQWQLSSTFLSGRVIKTDAAIASVLTVDCMVCNCRGPYSNVLSCRRCRPPKLYYTAAVYINAGQ